MMTEQRRLAAIVSADVAGYSRLMGRDESGTLAALKAVRQEVVDPAIAMHGGRIVKTTGDGLLLEFPSVVNAVRCAVEVQTAMAGRTADIAEDRRIAFRIGINLGDIIVEGDDIFGDGVNVAARLQEIAAPGGTCISSRVHEDVRDRLDTEFDDGGTQTLKNIVRPVQVWRWQPGTAVRAELAPAPTALPLPEKPSIAVLPFQNMSGDPEQEYFADGVVEDIITALSRFKSLFVIARNSSFTYKGRAVDIKQVGRELGVRYVLEGSVRKAGGRVRITGQLIEAATGAHLWADRFDGPLEDVFDIQDRVTRNVVEAVIPALDQAEMARAKRKPVENLDAYDSFLRGIALFRQFTRETNNQALGLFYRAIELAPDYAVPYAWATHCYNTSKLYAWDYNPVVADTEVRHLSQRVASLGQDDAWALAVVGTSIAYVCREYDAAKAFSEQAIAINPNLVSAWIQGGIVSILCSEHDAAIERLSRARSMTRSGHELHYSQGYIALPYFLTGRYAEAASCAVQAASHLPTWLFPHLASGPRTGCSGISMRRAKVSSICAS